MKDFYIFVKMDILAPIWKWICSLFRKKRSEPEQACTVFYASEYLSRIEQASLDIMEDRDPVDTVIILWWGLDGLRLNEDGTMEWISRKKPEPVSRNVFYQPSQYFHPIQTGMFQFDQTQSTRAQIDELMSKNASLQIQAAQTAQNAAIIQCCCNWPR